MASRTAQAGAQSAGQVATSGFANSLPGGWIGYATTTTSSGLITAETSLASIGLTQAVTVGTSRRIKIDLTCRIDYNNSTGDRWILRIKEGSTELKLARGPASGFATNPITATCWTVLTPSAGSHTYFASVERIGTNSIQVLHGGGEVGELLIMDIGPA
jgi:hypothetical protein